VFAVNRDKDVPGILRRLLAAFPHVVLTQFHNNPRVLPVEELAAMARAMANPEVSPHIEIARDTAAALQAAHAATPADGLICVTGSFFLAAEARRLLVRPHEN
jgi:dihydrofolate synthase/folylpolyglutamate synthase